MGTCLLSKQCGILYQWKENYEGVMDFWPNPKANTQKTAEFAPDLTLTAFFDLQECLSAKKMQLFLVN